VKAFYFFIDLDEDCIDKPEELKEVREKDVENNEILVGEKESIGNGVSFLLTYI